MRTSDEFFFQSAIKTEIPELKAASEQFARGYADAADGCFAKYIKEALKSKAFNTLPCTLLEDIGDVKEEAYADQVLEGYVCSVGYKYCFPGGVMDWTHNPTYNNYNEFSFHLQYHNELLVLARAYERTADEKYAVRFNYMINTWIDQAECPEDESGFGGQPLWRSLEAGVRMASTWPYMINAFLNSPSVPDRTWVKIFRSICDHGHRLTKNNTRNTHNNWIITEMRGLLTMGLNFPFMASADYWTEYALTCLKEEIALQIYPDGMQIELTTRYHSGIIANYQKAEALLRLYGRRVPEKFDRYIRCMYSMYTQLCRPDLYTPALNDGTEADVVRYTGNAWKRYPDDESFRYFATKRAEGTPPDYLSSILPYAGFAVMRTGWGADAIWAFFDAGLEGVTHIHEDKLAFQLSAYGCNMLADTGTYAYDTSDMRKYVIGTRSHSTGLVDGCGQNRIARHFGNLDRYHQKKVDLTFTFTDELEIVQGSYDQGYGSDFIDVTHTRRVIFFKKGLDSLPFFLIYDTFASNDEQEHLYEVSFQMCEQKISACGHRTETAFENNSTLSLISDAYPKITIGQYAPEFMGWQPIHASGDHEHLPVPMVSYSKKGMTAEFATVVFPAPTAEAPSVAVAVQEGKITLTVGGKEIVCDMKDEKYMPKTTVDEIK
ncbi:MAG: alginate lyase family protein [Clostridia bacterium]|nr:alginate lyase family protein [Clostridia bacterium]